MIDYLKWLWVYIKEYGWILPFWCLWIPGFSTAIETHNGILGSISLLLGIVLTLSIAMYYAFRE